MLEKLEIKRPAVALHSLRHTCCQAGSGEPIHYFRTACRGMLWARVLGASVLGECEVQFERVVGGAGSSEVSHHWMRLASLRKGWT